jgi:hypothetical protein
MKFSVAGSRIICSRKDNTVDNKAVYRRVVEFDAHVETIPPHVAARLTSGEIEQLQEFLADRKRIQATPAEQNMLEALPGLLREATEILKSVDTVNKTMYTQLSRSIGELVQALDNVKPAPSGGPTPVNRMRKSEAQKERLENIKQEL